MMDYRQYTILGDLTGWFNLLKSMGRVSGKTRAQLAGLAGVKYNKFCRAFREQLLPLGILEEDGSTEEVVGRPTVTFKVTQKGGALISAIENVENVFGEFSR